MASARKKAAAELPLPPQDHRSYVSDEDSLYVARFMAGLAALYCDVPPAYFGRLAALLVQNGVEVTYSSAQGAWRLNLWSPGRRRDRGPRMAAYVAGKLREFCADPGGLMLFPAGSAARIAQSHFDEIRAAIRYDRAHS
jgi:hypothetical protein